MDRSGEAAPSGRGQIVDDRSVPAEIARQAMGDDGAEQGHPDGGPDRARELDHGRGRADRGKRHGALAGNHDRLEHQPASDAEDDEGGRQLGCARARSHRRQQQHSDTHDAARPSSVGGDTGLCAKPTAP